MAGLCEGGNEPLGSLKDSKAARQRWTQAHCKWGLAEWHFVLFMDETRIALHPDSYRTRVWRRKGSHAKLQHVQEMHAFRRGQEGSLDQDGRGRRQGEASHHISENFLIDHREKRVFVHGRISDRLDEEIFNVQELFLLIRSDKGREFYLLHSLPRAFLQDWMWNGPMIDSMDMKGMPIEKDGIDECELTSLIELAYMG
ncbi:hypothetical protein ANN_11413 [Periplaneta americana]|uniref:Uncharacterized protein n=1 Tax=Periplaneta americana TaxID=6978 RepID=A0ABQ8T6M4_PERAM|nr:hypothetical protein ANN_11413 [Periplaneta americana]